STQHLRVSVSVQLVPGRNNEGFGGDNRSGDNDDDCKEVVYRSRNDC
ncbi:hypothetical protein RRG08_019853, partial [Elysia crispata]